VTEAGAQDREGRRQRLITLAIVALVPTILFADVLLGLASLHVRDVSFYHYPHQKMLRDIVLGGEFPYWNPYMSAGQPVAANPAYQTFYPLTWLILLPDYHTGFHLLAILHLYIAAFAMYALLRSMELGRPAAAFGAVCFGAGGLAVSLLNLFPFLFSMAWLPLTCLFIRRFLLHRTPRDFAFAALFLGLQLLTGEPVTAVQTGLLLGFYALYRVLRDGGGWTGAAKSIGAIALLGLVALLLSAVQTLPAVDHLGDSTRGQGMAFKDVSEWSTPFFRFAEVVYPNVMGRGDAEGWPVYWGARLYPRRGTAFFFSLYSGLAVAVLCLAGVLGRVRGRWLFVTIASFSALVASGDQTPLLDILYGAGIAALARFPEKFTIMGVFALVVFGAHTLDRLLAGDERVRRMAIAVTAGVTLAAFSWAALAQSQLHETLFRNLFTLNPRRNVEPLLALFRHEALLAACRGVLLLLLFRNVMNAHRRVWLALFGIFVLFDIAAQAPQIAPRIAPSYYREPPPTMRHFRPERGEYRIFHAANWDQTTSLTARYPIDANFPWVARNSLAPMVPSTFGLRTVIDGDFDVTDLAAEREFSNAVWELANKKTPDWMEIAAAMSNAWYVGLYQKREQTLAQAGGWNRNVEPVKFIEGEHFPRYYFARQLVTVDGSAAFIHALRTRRFHRQVAFIREPAFEPAAGIVRAKRESANSTRLEVETAGRAFLVMSVTPHKYWRVTIDGAETPSLVANVGYQGVVVPPGRHLVEMRYRNPLVAAGAAISLAALLGLAFAVRRSSHTIRAL